MRKLAVAALLTALAVPAPALAADRTVGMNFNRLNPSTLPALPGETVGWANSDRVVHNVTPRPGSAMPPSGDLGPGATWEHLFAAPGVYRYYCTYHPATMSGTVVVKDLHLTGPASVLTHGARATFTGYARRGEAVTLTRSDGSQVGAATASATDGRFTIVVFAVRPDAYRATSAGKQSDAVIVKVRPKLALTSRRSGSRLIVSVAATPAQAGAPVVVQRRVGSRWVKIAGGRLNASSKATFRVARKAMSIRARTTRGVSGYSVTTSRVLAVR